MIEPWYDLFYMGPLCHAGNAYALHLAPDLCDDFAAEVAAERRAQAQRWENDASEFAARRAVIAAMGAVPPVKMPARLVMRYGVLFCLNCNLSVMYCRCNERHADAPSGDATAESNLAQRIRDAKAGTK